MPFTLLCFLEGQMNCVTNFYFLCVVSNLNSDEVVYFNHLMKCLFFGGKQKLIDEETGFCFKSHFGGMIPGRICRFLSWWGGERGDSIQCHRRE